MDNGTEPRPLAESSGALSIPSTRISWLVASKGIDHAQRSTTSH